MEKDFHRFLEVLADTFDFPNLAPDAHGACLIHQKEHQAYLLFEFDEQLVPNTVLVSSPVLPLPVHNRADILEACLKGNHENLETLSIKNDEGVIYLHRRVHPNIEKEELQHVLDSLLNQIKVWRQKINDLSTQPPQSHRFHLPPHMIDLSGKA